MSNSVSFSIYLKDFVSDGLSQLGKLSDRTFDGMEEDADGFNRAVKRSRGGLNDLGGGLSSLKGLAVQAFAGFAAFEAVRGIGKMALDMEQTEVAFSTMLGSVEAGKKSIADLKQFANFTPFEPEPVIKSGRSLLAFGFAANDVVNQLTKVGNVASGVGMPLNELSDIYGKARVQGTLFAEDINQMTGRGIPVITELAKVMGVAESEVKKLGSEGKITFPLLEKAFGNMSSEGGRFYKLMEKQSETGAGKLSTLIGLVKDKALIAGTAGLDSFKSLLDNAIELVNGLSPVQNAFGKLLDAVQPLKAAFSNVLTGFGLINQEQSLAQSIIGGLTTGINSLASAFNYVSPAITQVSGFVADNAKEIGGLTAIVGGAVAGYKLYGMVTNFAAIKTAALTAKQWALNVAMSANPIGLVVGGLAALVAGILYAWNNFEGFRGFLYGLWSSVKEVFGGIAEMGKNVFGGLADLVKGFATGNIDAMSSGLSKLMKGAGNFSEIGQKAAAGFNQGYMEGVNDFRMEKMLEEVESDPGTASTQKQKEAKTQDKAQENATVAASGSGLAGLSASAAASKRESNIKSGLSSVSGDNAKARSLIVNIDSLIDNLTFHTTNINEARERIAEIVQQTIINAVRDVETSY